jgi:hypothetical protein
VNIWSPLCGHHGGDPAVSQPAKQAAKFSAQHTGVGGRRTGFDGIEHHALGANLLDGVSSLEQAFEIVFTRFSISLRSTWM